MNELKKLKRLFKKIEDKYEKEKSLIKKKRLFKKAVAIEKRISEITL